MKDILRNVEEGIAFTASWNGPKRMFEMQETELKGKGRFLNE